MRFCDGTFGTWNGHRIHLGWEGIALKCTIVVSVVQVLALSSGCVGLPNGTSDFLAWGFADDCLRVCPVAAIDGSGMAERRVLVSRPLPRLMTLYTSLGKRVLTLVLSLLSSVISSGHLFSGLCQPHLSISS